MSSDCTFRTCMLSIPEVDVFKINNVCYVLKYPFEKSIKDPINVYRCRTCNARCRHLMTLCGPNGSLFLAGVPDNVLIKETPLFDARCNAVKATARDGQVPTLQLVTQNTFPPIEEGRTGLDPPWTHPTIRPRNVTSPHVARTFERLWNVYGGTTMDVRLDKLTDPDAEASLAIVRSAASASNHPDHWMSTLEWIRGLRTASGGHSLSNMTQVDKMRIRVHALTTGSFTGSLHADFQKSQNIIDFIEKGESERAVVSMMNERRDESNYMVPQIARAMAHHAVTDKRTISLSWRTRDDLDLHVFTPNGTHVYYGNARKNMDGLMLNFDANANTCVSDPVENVSVLRDPGTDAFRIYVNNFNTRTTMDVPFVVVIKEEGYPDVVHEGVWWNTVRGANPGNDVDMMLHVATHTFRGAHDDGTVAMTDKERARALANASLWDANMGTPQSRIATLKDVPDDEYMVHILPSSTPAPRTSSSVTSEQVNNDFMAMALGSTGPKKNKKTYLADRCAPRTLMDLVRSSVQDGVPLHVRIHDVSPGYMVRILNTHTKVVWDDLQPCHYRDQGHPPTVPTSRGNARLCGEWFEDGRHETDMARVAAVVVKKGGSSPPFLALEGARLPSTSSVNFPRGAGFYATALRPEFHVLRDRWCTHHTRLAVDAVAPSHITSVLSSPLVGGFVSLHDNHVFHMNGEKVTITM